MNQQTLQILELCIKYGGALGGLLLFFRGYLEYRRSNATKRADFLEKMISEFKLPEKKIAIALLDDFGYTGTHPCPDGVNLTEVLRNHHHRAINTMMEVDVRASFDQLLDFYTKLSYYIQNDLMSSRELIYFRYYIEKVEQNKAVEAYIRCYFYWSDFEALYKALPKDK
jgi:hypothetical protein